MSKPFAWSYSALNSFETCPRRHNLTKSKQVVEPQTDALLWGNKVHKALENRLKLKSPLAETMSAYEPLVAAIEHRGRGGVIEAEGKLSTDRDYNPVGYFAPTVWVRGITDFTVVKKASAFVGDWKTGRPTPASAQLALCAALTFAYKPYLEKIITSFVWLQNGTTTNAVYTKADLPDIWNEFHPRVKRMEHAIESENYPPKPSGLCRKHCPVPRSMCEHSGLS